MIIIAHVESAIMIIIELIHVGFAWDSLLLVTSM